MLQLDLGYKCSSCSRTVFEIFKCFIVLHWHEIMIFQNNWAEAQQGDFPHPRKPSNLTTKAFKPALIT